MNTADFPNREPFLDSNGLVAPRPLVWLRDLRSDVNNTSAIVPGGSITLASKSAAVSTTPFDTAALTAGLYRVSAVTQIITPASINSSVIITFSFTLRTVACSISSPAVTSNDPTKPGVFIAPIAIDGGTPVSYSIAYVSNAAGMVYSTQIALESVNV